MTDSKFNYITSRMEQIDAKISTLMQFTGTDTQINDLSQEYILLAQMIGLSPKDANKDIYVSDEGIVEELPV